MAPPRRPAAGGTATFSSSIPGTHPPCFCHFTTSHGHTRRAAEACAPSTAAGDGSTCTFAFFSAFFFLLLLIFFTPCSSDRDAWFVSEERKALPAAVFVQNDGFVCLEIFFFFFFSWEGTWKGPWASPLAGPPPSEPIRRPSSRPSSRAVWRGEKHTRSLRNAQTAPQGAAAERVHVRAPEVCVSRR